MPRRMVDEWQEKVSWLLFSEYEEATDSLTRFVNYLNTIHP